MFLIVLEEGQEGKMKHDSLLRLGTNGQSYPVKPSDTDDFLLWGEAPKSSSNITLVS